MNKKVKNKKKNSKFILFFLLVQMFISLIFIALISYLDFLPSNYYLLICGFISILMIISFFTLPKKKNLIIYLLISIITSTILFLASFYLGKTVLTLNRIANSQTKVDDIAIIVLNDNEVESISDSWDFNFGVVTEFDKDNNNNTIEYLNNLFDNTIKTTSFKDLSSQIKGLYQGSVDAIIFNEAYRDLILLDYPDFNETTRVLNNHQITSKVEVVASDKDLSKDTFNIYISGIDSYGQISRTSRSDVNIIMTINPVTKEILLTSTPRDYYLEFPISAGKKDKLTHAGIYGVDISMATLENLYDLKLDYFVRVNFSSLIKMVDVLGGINVNSDYNFTAGDYSFVVGDNFLNGDQALAFSRERHSFKDGDIQRGKNQMLVINAMIKKAFSPDIISNFSGILETITGSFETNMKTEDMTELIKMQLGDMAEWTITSNSVTGSGARLTTYSYPNTKLYVMIPDENSVENAKNEIVEIKN